MVDWANIKKENAAYDELIAAGYQPQGRNSKGKCAVFRISNEHRNNEVQKTWAFDSWQGAADYLINK